MADLTEQIEQTAAEPASATGDGQSATAHSLPDLIEADRYLKGKEAVAGTNPNGGPKTAFGTLGVARIKPGGAGPC